MVRELRKRGVETSLIRLEKLTIGECVGCYSKKSSSCVYPCIVVDDASDVYTHLAEEAECLVFVTPTYWSAVPGKLKNFVDRLTSLENNGYLLEGVTAAILAVQEVSGGIEAATWLAGTLNQMGALIPPYGVQVYFTNRVAKGIRQAVGAKAYAKEFWTKRDAKLLADNLVKIAGMKTRSIRFGYKP